MMKNLTRQIISFLSAVCFLGLGVAVDALELCNKTACFIALIAIAVLPIFSLLLQRLLSKSYARRFRGQTVEERQRFLVSHRSEAEKTAAEKLSLLRRLRMLTRGYTALLWLLAASVAFLGGFFGESTFVLSATILYAYFLFYAVYSRKFAESPIVFDNDAHILNKTDAPQILAILDRAAKAVGCEKPVVPVLSPQCDASVAQDKDKICILIGLRLLYILSEEELYCVFLHELAHVSPEHRALHAMATYHIGMMNQGENQKGIYRIAPSFFLFFDMVYSMQYMLYQYAASLSVESGADLNMVKYGSAEAAASVLRKTRYDDYYTWEREGKSEFSIFEGKFPISDWLRREVQDFCAAVTERRRVWDDMIDKEILANNATHPTLGMRLRAIGAEDYGYVACAHSPEYRAEIDRAGKALESRILEEIAPEYDSARKVRYLDPLARVTDWKNAGMPLAPETYADLISDLQAIGKGDEAEALCDRAIAELDELSSVHAHFVKGCTLLHRYDPAGLPHLYHAVEKNKNYLEEGLSCMGSFCCMTGREEDLQAYRAFAARMAQTAEDEDEQAGFLSKKDRLSKENLPDGMLEEILSYIRSVDEAGLIMNVYLVRKTISETFFTSAFIIHFYGGTDEARNEIMHKIVRYLDSHPSDWHFSLFDYFEFPEVKVEKIPGSLVYSKSQQQKG